MPCVLFVLLCAADACCHLKKRAYNDLFFDSPVMHSVAVKVLPKQWQCRGEHRMKKSCRFVRKAQIIINFIAPFFRHVAKQSGFEMCVFTQAPVGARFTHVSNPIQNG